MAAQKGSALLMKIGNGASPEVFTTIGGMRSTSISMNDEVVDITIKIVEEQGQFRKLQIQRQFQSGTIDSASKQHFESKFDNSTPTISILCPRL